MDRPSRYGAPDPEKLDTTPVALPVGACQPTPLQDIVARLVREAIELEKDEEFESFEESNDFEEEDPDTLNMSPYELTDMTEEFLTPEAQEAPQETPDDDPASTTVQESAEAVGKSPDAQ